MLVLKNPRMVTEDFCGIRKFDVVSCLINSNAVEAGYEAEFLNFNYYFGVDD